MGNAAIAFDNVIDLDTTALFSAQEATTPVSLLKDPHVMNRWFTPAGSGGQPSVFADFGSPKLIDTVAVIGLTGPGGSALQFQVRLALADPIAGDVYNTGFLSNQFDNRYLPLVHLIPTVKSARYLLLSFNQTGVSNIGAGRLFAGVRNEFAINFQPGWSRTPVSTSPRQIGAMGQTFVDPRRGHWAVEATFAWISETERNAFVESLDVAIVNEGHRDMLWIKDVASTNLSRDCIWGYQDGDAPITQPIVSVPARFSKSYRIRERL
jgi:hypothetical protein